MAVAKRTGKRLGERVTYFRITEWKKESSAKDFAEACIPQVTDLTVNPSLCDRGLDEKGQLRTPVNDNGRKQTCRPHPHSPNIHPHVFEDECLRGRWIIGLSQRDS
ncbi:7429_t:CDS:2 [Acaulospora colombiana]|uniref:7429_t:CDS:1 n=1 Tax=Acaulospora colombiana TaxID=27376 RepID=A0ACA9LHV0_9GLOM|nr:7429_t:CDS:2 [Acaulospora colombiana]